MIRIAILLVIAVGVIAFALQNLSPIALVILGVRTQALPLAFWVLGALAAGSLTTLLLSGFLSISKRFAVRQSNQSTASPPRSPWSDMGNRPPESSGRTGRTGSKAAGFRTANSTADSRSRAADDWETEQRDDWDDWGEEPSPRRTADRPVTDRPVTDRPVTDRPTSNRYEDRTDRSARTDRSSESRYDRPINFEPRTSRTPRSADRASQPADRGAGQVYDAEYRVLIPPYTPPDPVPGPTVGPPPNPTPNSTPNPTPDPLDDEDWGLDDDTDRTR